ncbi:phosphonate C-P lyase system protein PhnH [Mycobacterium sp. ACS1612]|uniref:phosphonate C-P lyase system protein PhnH n=1 Tax=Mycobacterium sp. ACS1612 TaxID=1834117 RepID=UPI0007FD56E2|nr:phosphonate C-P lyase system protein PhnH [Mycobacterium sp. ACS1612]OBF38095.1 phosphonate C-P lyase system protein PhnH [Mycobacterium sp. ACS1612]
MTGVFTAALHPTDTQQVFRAVLEALARPGSAMMLPDDPLKTLAPAITPIFALADLGTGVCVLEHADDRWSEAVTTATGAPLWPAELARLVAVLRPVTEADVRDFARGTAADPSAAALVCIAVPEVHGGPRRWRLSGPGIAGETTLSPVGLPPGFVTARAEAVAGYPAGIDVLLITGDGRVVGLPRTTSITEEN